MDPDPESSDFLKAKKRSATGLENLLKEISSEGDNSLHKFQEISTYNTVLDAINKSIQTKDMEIIIMEQRERVVLHRSSMAAQR